MKPTTHHHHLLIPWAVDGEIWRRIRAMFPAVTPEETLACYFSNLAFMLEDGWAFGADNPETFRHAVHMLDTLVASDMEGMSPVSGEFDLEEVDAIHEFVKNLTWDLWSIIHAECWHRCQLNFVRLLRDAIIVAYHGEKPFQTRPHIPFLPALLSEI